MKKINWPKMLLLIGICEGVGFLSGLLSGNMKSFYNSLIKPVLAPPGLLFPIAWGILYALMGIALYFVITSNRGSYSEQRSAIIYFALQLAVNFSWSIVFFRFQSLIGGLIVILLLDLLVLITMVKFKAINKLSFWLLIPYLVWILFATYLNIGFVLLN